MDMEVMVFSPLELSGKFSACEASHPLRSKPAPWIVSRSFREKGFRRSLSLEILTRMSKMPPTYPLDYAKSLFLNHFCWGRDPGIPLAEDPRTQGTLRIQIQTNAPQS